jgi:hypothetical protein
LHSNVDRDDRRCDRGLGHEERAMPLRRGIVDDEARPRGVVRITIGRVTL